MTDPVCPPDHADIHIYTKERTKKAEEQFEVFVLRTDSRNEDNKIINTKGTAEGREGVHTAAAAAAARIFAVKSFVAAAVSRSKGGFGVYSTYIAYIVVALQQYIPAAAAVPVVGDRVSRGYGLS